MGIASELSAIQDLDRWEREELPLQTPPYHGGVQQVKVSRAFFLKGRLATRCTRLPTADGSLVHPPELRISLGAGPPIARITRLPSVVGSLVVWFPDQGLVSNRLKLLRVLSAGSEV